MFWEEDIPAPKQPDMLRDIEGTHFFVNRVTIVRLEAQAPLPKRYLELAQEGMGHHTTQIDRFSWTTFKNWELALRFFLRQHCSQYQGNEISALPISIPGFTYEKLMDTYKGRAGSQLTITEIPHVPRWPPTSTGPPSKKPKLA